MERHKIEKKHRRKPPGVPIQTYRWEDVRRARLRGGYPWTYLYKEPFDEEANPSKFMMEGMQKSKSSATLRRTSEGVDIQDVTGELTETKGTTFLEEPFSYITEVPSDSENHSKNEPRGSIIIQEEMEEPEHLNLESAESSDNISQYLDKDEVIDEPPKDEKMDITSDEPNKLEVTSAKEDKTERAKSEEPKRKRKLSGESSYSRKSLSKLAFIKKLKEAKEKIKVPRLSLPDFFKKETPDDNKEKVEDKVKPIKPAKKVDQPPADVKPVYIHIPLKPPDGQTDEFSYLEFEEKKDPLKEEPATVDEAPMQSESVEPKPEDITEQTTALDENLTLDHLPSDERRFSENPDEIVAIEILKTETIDLHENGIKMDGNNDIFIVQPDPNSKHNDDVIIILSGTDEPGPSLVEQTVKSLSRQGSRKVRAKSAEPERKRKGSLESSYSRRSLSKLGFLKKLKEAKDKLKFPTLSLSRSNSKKEKPKKAKDEPAKGEPAKEEPAKEKEQPKKLEVQNGAEPKYIHIPLKPPPGQSDEFSYLEFETKKEEAPKENVKDEKESIESPAVSPASVETNGVQFIFLTPPSDDEILDDHCEIPETPQSSNEPFFSHKIEELKKIAKGAVDKMSNTRDTKLEPVAEIESEKIAADADKLEKESQPQEEQADNVDAAHPETEKMVIDEEDGLKLTESAMAKQEQNIKSKEVKEQPQELKSSLKSDGSPILKKKVSFKRRSRDEAKDGIYEEIQAPKDEAKKELDTKNLTDEQKNKLSVLENSQSMSVDEEKSYLDEQIVKSTSLEEDYNRWSKISDHEYEPVNPPPDDMPTLSIHPPTVHVTDTDNKKETTCISQPVEQTTSEDDTNIESQTIEKIQKDIEDRYFSSSSSKNDDSAQRSTSKDSTTQENLPPNDQKKSESAPSTPSKFHQAFKSQADKFRNKLSGIKRPQLSLPSRPKFEKPNLQKLKFHKPNLHLPKIPDTARISLPTFSLPRRNPAKRSLKERQFSTESNAGDTKKKYFDFSTYPRIFKKKPKHDFDSTSSKNEPEPPEFATVPRAKSAKRNQQESDRWGGQESIRIPLHPEESVDSSNREDSVERRMASLMRYDDEIDTDEAYEKENQEIHRASPFSHGYNNRWNHGSFHPDPNVEFRENLRNQEYRVTDLDSPGDGPAPNDSFDTNTSKDIHSSESSLGVHRRGVLEEIDSDEFFLRQKGISQDNIEVGMYLSSEIREAFKSPTNALTDLQRDPRLPAYETRASNQSLPETPSKRKNIKKPKRKKTPHVSQEVIPYTPEDSEPEEYLGNLPPARPRRRSKKKKSSEIENVIPYQETIPLDVESNILQYVDDDSDQMRNTYENEQMEGKDQPQIQVTDPYTNLKYADLDESAPKPEAPPRRQKSLRSLNYSEHDSIIGELNVVSLEKVAADSVREYINAEQEEAPVKPPRTLSRSSSKSHDINDQFKYESNEFETEEAPLPPRRARSRSGTRSQPDDDRTSQGADSFLSESQPCFEEPCCQDIRDYMGYAVIDKNQRREPPLPPPRTPPRRKRSLETRFFTVPRPLNDTMPPVRPLRNYSTLGPSRPPRRKHVPNMTDEEKENIEIDITQYIEIEDEPNRDLHSGEVIQKMRDRPLPAPPRPPRKSRALNDITSEDNIVVDIAEDAEVPTQTEPSDLDYEKTRQEDIETSTVTKSEDNDDSSTIRVERHLITPTHYTHEETITHGTLLVEPLNGAKILRDSDLTRKEAPVERTIPITREFDDFETSEVPEEFTKLKDPNKVQIVERPASVLSNLGTEVEVLRAQKLQVGDLDVNRLTVNELLASKIVVSEIDSGTIQTNEIGSKSGSLKVGEIELPPSIVQQLFEQLQSAAQEQSVALEQPVSSASTQDAETSTNVEESPDSGQKKTPIDDLEVEIVPHRPPRKTEESPDVDMNVETVSEVVQTNSPKFSEDEEIISSDTALNATHPPEPPARIDSSAKMKEIAEELEIEESTIPESFSQLQNPPSETEDSAPQRPKRSSKPPKTDESDAPPPEPRQTEEPEVDDEPPPRPPQPRLDYIPSQPPASFYALRAQHYVESLDDDIPTAPRRRRHPKPPASRSSSDESPAPPPVRRRHRTPEPTISELTGQLMHACGSAAQGSIKRLIAHVSNNILRNADGNQDLHVVIVTLVVLIAILLILGYGDEKTVHYHHWEYFNPPRDI